jgi:hypothetical protein
VSQAAGLASKVELEIEVDQVVKGLSGDFAYCTLPNLCEDSIQEFAEERCSDASGAVC